MAYFVGIDSGGTKTECWLGDETRVLAQAVCGSVKLTRVGQSVAEERLAALLEEVSQSAGVPLADVTATCVGMSGSSIRQLREWMAGAVAGRVGGVLEVCGDEEIALDAAFEGGPGILVIAGTGSIVVGRCRDGVRFTAGGWGPVLGDEGSGAWIGVEALRAGFRALDRGQETGLLEAVQAAWGVADPAEVVALAHALPAPDFAALTPVVLRLTQAGDQVAGEVLQRGGEALGEQVRTVWRAMQRRGETEASVAGTGSIMTQVEPVRSAMARSFPEELSRSIRPVHALDGALWRARQAGSLAESLTRRISPVR